ncbi:MAG: hypothetical protein HWQ36_25980 [Nostoc sp. NMS2]|uniref:DUF6464 family protein n=1 Tax=Nostoc sp. NMS2 TaxID=2815389 RepID=UPI002600CB16|nr:DUF6464 family protein [Nostoc sp. NMS2]MBN3993836.1 hypothetical protein [Nostoc sp. NMS2]
MKKLNNIYFYTALFSIQVTLIIFYFIGFWGLFIWAVFLLIYLGFKRWQIWRDEGRTFDEINQEIELYGTDDFDNSPIVLDNSATVQTIGDLTCINNARSSYLRCTVNPCGPCQGCKDYEPSSKVSCKN